MLLWKLTILTFWLYSIHLLVDVREMVKNTQKRIEIECADEQELALKLACILISCGVNLNTIPSAGTVEFYKCHVCLLALRLLLAESLIFWRVKHVLFVGNIHCSNALVVLLLFIAACSVNNRLGQITSFNVLYQQWIKSMKLIGMYYFASFRISF